MFPHPNPWPGRGRAKALQLGVLLPPVACHTCSSSWAMRDRPKPLDYGNVGPGAQ